MNASDNPKASVSAQTRIEAKQDKRMRLFAWKKDGDCIRCTSHTSNRGNGRLQVSKNGKMFSLYRLVASRRNKIDGLLVRHDCDNPWCINPDHLRVGTHQDNSDDMMARGRHRTPLGEAQVTSKLTERAVHDIRSSKLVAPLLAKKYNVVESTIRKIRLGLTWRHVPIADILCHKEDKL